jgi:hypothetical protein
MRSRTLVGLCILASLAFVACSEKDEGEGLKGQDACLQTPAPIADPKFPAGFPDISDVTWTASQTAGPTQVVTGYTGDALDDLYRENKERFDKGGYKVTRSEKDPHDAEVAFANDKVTGQVQLSEECQGRRAVRVTIRPKS